MGSSMGSLAVGFSGISVAQAGLYVTGHNLSNVNSTGYTRQRVDQKDASYVTIGQIGKNLLQVGLGTDVKQIQQIRDAFLDRSFRAEASHKEFYSMKYEVVNEIENILGEIQGSSRLSESINNLWSSMHELVTHPDGLEARSMFVSNVTTFLDKVNDIGYNLEEYQEVLNGEIKEMTQRMNQIGIQINDLNNRIALGRISEDNPNDYLDQRNNLLDELSMMCQIDYYEDIYGSINILIEGNDFLINGSLKPIGMQYTAPNSGFLKPVYTSSKLPLSHDEPNVPEVFPRLFEPGKVIGSLNDSDNGKLKSLLLARGKVTANYTTPEIDVANFTIPSIQREFDIWVNKIVTMFNDAFAPPRPNEDGSFMPEDLEDEELYTPPYFTEAAADMYGNKYQNTGELFTRKNYDRYDEEGNIIRENPETYDTLYTVGNISVNVDILNNYNYLPLSITGDIGDTSLVTSILQLWKNAVWTEDDGTVVENQYAPSVNSTSNALNYEEYISSLITRLGQSGQEAFTRAQSEEQLILQINNKRQSISAVSLDEEMSNMLRYQHAYNAASRVVSQIDSMLDRLINRVGRVGL